MSSAKYCGCCVVRALNVISAILYSIRKRTGSQCRSASTGVMWSRRRVLVTTLASVFCRRCNYVRRWGTIQDCVTIVEPPSNHGGVMPLEQSGSVSPDPIKWYVPDADGKTVILTVLVRLWTSLLLASALRHTQAKTRTSKLHQLYSSTSKVTT